MLKRLWSPTGLFAQAIEFHPGLNLIIGRYSGDKRQRGINGIGKSSAIRLIDYLLLSDTAERRFAEAKYSFLKEENHQVCLDLEIAGLPVRIRRDFADNQHVYIQSSGEGEFCYRKEEANRILGGLFFPQDDERQLPGERYRSLMQFFIKDDLTNQTRRDPIAFVSHGGANKQELNTLNLFLLGLPNKPLIVLGEKRELLVDKQKQRKSVVERVEKFTGKPLAELKTDLTAREKDIEALQDSLKNFELLEDFKRVSATLADLENQISALRNTVDRSDRQLVKLRQFTSATREIDAADVAEQYKIVSNALGAAVRRSLEEVIAFRESLAQARLRFHGKRLRELEEGRTSALRELSGLEGRRASLLRAVEASNSSESLREAFERFATSKVEVERIGQAVADVSALDKEITDMSFDVDAARRDAVQAINSVEQSIGAIRELFVDIVEKAIGFTTQGEREGAYLDIHARSSGGRKQAPVDIDVEVPRGDALGHARLRLVAYDMTVFFHAVETGLPLPRFLIHDGAFHGIARRTVVRALNYVFQRSKEHSSFQYIATFNEDELSATPEEQARDGRFEFDMDELTVLTVADTADKMLFRRQFA